MYLTLYEHLSIVFRTLNTKYRFSAGANYRGERQVNLVDWLLNTEA